MNDICEWDGLDTYEKVKRAAEKYAGHVLRGSSGLSHLQILEGTVKGEC